MNSLEHRNQYKKYVPLLTLICSLISIVLFIGINLEPDLESWDAYQKWGAPDTHSIFNGRYWGLISSNFLHVEILHLVFNLYWFWVFGKKMEYEIGEISFLFLIISSALISSLAELGFSGESGIGLSGIVYAFFGFILIKSKASNSYDGFLNSSTIRLFVMWMLFCIVLSYLKIFPIANAAHVGGFIWGLALAYFSEFKKLPQWVMGSLLFLTIASSVFWSPTSTAWLSYRAYELHFEDRFQEAKLLYEKILSRDPDNELVLANLEILEIEVLMEEAYQFHIDYEYEEARKAYEEILRLDENNEWAKESILLLPDL